MLLIPAIDLKDGQCVRLLRGEMEAATVFSDDPAAQAAAFEAAGCEWIHLVDLNGAFAGEPVNVVFIGSCTNGRVSVCPRNWAAASGTWRPSKGGSRRGWRA